MFPTQDTVSICCGGIAAGPLSPRALMALEIVALRQQVSVLKRRNPRPRLSPWDQLFWVFLRRVWSGWAEVLLLVKPETVVRRRRAGFRLYWHFLSRRSEKGKPRIGFELCQLIESMAKEDSHLRSPQNPLDIRTMRPPSDGSSLA